MMSANVLECPEKSLLVTLLYAEEGDSEERRRVEGHLLVCEACQAELHALRGVRGALTQWTTPPMPLGFRVVREPVVVRPRRWWVAAPLAAAAALVLAAAAALANLEVTVGSQGLTVRTGWANGEMASEAAASEAGTEADRNEAVPDAATSNVAASREVGSRGAGPSRAGPSRAGQRQAGASGAPRDDVAPWQADLAALEQEIQRRLDEATVVTATSTTSERPMSEQDVLREVRALIARSEAQQQEQLATQISDLVTQFQLQRREDLVRISHEIGGIKARQGVDQRMLDDFVRVVSAQQP